MMGYSRVLSGFGRRSPWLMVGSFLALGFMLGCGEIYRPIVTNVPPVQPAPQPTKYAIVISCGNNPNPSAANIYDICTGSTAPGLASFVDFSGDSLMVRVNLGTGPRWLALDSPGLTAYIPNTDGTINSFFIQNSTETNNVDTSTLLANAKPNALLSTANYLYVSQPGRSSIGVLQPISSGSAPSTILEIPITDPAHDTVNQNPVNLVGRSSGQRIYAISQGGNAANCPTSGSTGSASAIEIATNTISAVLPLGVCPVYGVMTQDKRRAFILNQGSGTVTVIDSQQNQIDNNPNLNGGTGTITVGQGPVWADIYNNGAILAVANSLSNTLSLINISVDSFGNDTPNFGQIIATVPVGSGPSSVSILQDGTRAYVANRNDGTVSVVSLTSNTVLKTIPLPEEPCQASQPNVLCKVHPISIAATTGQPLGKVYVVSPDTNIMTILRTDNDTIYTNIGLTGTGVQVRVTAP
jgi:YVTN family beta-propeller protein